ncbi:MAG: lipocalin family protein [Raineya sp.]|nr:lipocalin family protein [Raineya sp.]MDW8296464.1 lipocalin family protein [Raineya sp.]
MKAKVLLATGWVGLFCLGCDTKKEPKPDQSNPSQLPPLAISEIVGTWKLIGASLISPIQIADIYDVNNPLLNSNPVAREGFCTKNSLLTLNADNTCREEFVEATYHFPNSTTQNCSAVTYTGSFTFNSNARTISLDFNNPNNNKVYFVKSVENNIMIVEAESTQGGTPSKRSVTYQKQ